MVKQVIQFEHNPARVRLASIQLMMKRLREPRCVVLLAALLLLLFVGLLTSRQWMVVLPLATFAGMSVFSIAYIATSVRNFCGVAATLSICHDGMHFSSPHRSGVVAWAGFREIYILKEMWALFLKNSQAVTLIPTDKFEHATLEFALAKLRENGAKIHGNRK